MSERVMMPGVMVNIGEAYQSAQAFVISSRYEAFGLVTAEAMSYGLPVIGFADCPGTNEIIINGLNGILVEPDDDRVISLAQALSTLLSNQDLRQKFGSAGRQSILTYFSSRQICNKWEELLSECCKPSLCRVPKNKNDGVN
jgi:glycosyltransferase involved in cell wall biosynthesis